jgi:Effector Associated Constant Component 1
MSGVAMLAVADGDGGELAAWLAAEDELRGCVHRVPAAVPTAALGAGLAQLAVSLASGGTATALASTVIAWLRRRNGSVTVRVSRPDGGTIEVRADRVREMDADALRALADQMAAMVWPGDDVAEESGSGGDAGD